MGSATKQKIDAILAAIKSTRTAKEVVRVGRITIEGNNRYLTTEVMQRDIEDAIRFVAQVLNYTDIESIWRMDVYEFYRDFVRAHNIQKQQLEQIKKNKKKWQTK